MFLISCFNDKNLSEPSQLLQLTTTDMYSCLLVLVTFIQYAWCQDSNCDFVQNVQPGETYSVFSPNYPGQYARGIQCRWVANCPTGYNCRLDCTNVTIPQSNSCSMDRLLISLSGDPTLTNADTYCDTGTITNLVSGQRISLGLITSSNSPGGMFLCALRAQVSRPPSPSCSCGYKKTNRIVGGQETEVNEYPMMAAIMKTSYNDIYCGAVIIHQHYLITAAHCLYQQPLSDFEILVGSHNIFQDSPSTQRMYIADAIIHPNYDPSTYDYDIALIMTTRDMEFNAQVGPACLPFKFEGQDLTSNKVEALGWGTLEPGGPISNTLQKVQLDVISQSSCRSSESAVTRRQLCTYTPGRDACQYDSGGPILYTDPATGLLFNVGIISHGRFCASGSPGVNTRVTEMLSWVRYHTNDANYCVK